MARSSSSSAVTAIHHDRKQAIAETALHSIHGLRSVYIQCRTYLQLAVRQEFVLVYDLFSAAVQPVMSRLALYVRICVDNGQSVM